LKSNNGVKIAQVGVGYWGKNLFRNFFRCRNVNEIIACDSDPKAKDWLDVDYPGVHFVQQTDSLLNDKKLDAVVIATPASDHFQLAKECLLADKHVFVEKPLSLTVQEAEELVQISTKKNLILMVGHTFLFNSAVDTIKEYIKTKLLGEVYYIYSQRLNLGRVRQDVDVIWNLAPHDISILLYWLDEMPNRVNVKGYYYLQPGIADVAFLNLEFPSGFSAHIHVSWLDPNKRRNMTIVGSKKMISYEDTSADAKVKIYDKGITKQSMEHGLGEFDNFGKFQLIHRAGDLLIPKINFQEPLRIECEHFVECVISGRQPKTYGFHGLQVIKVLEAASQSLLQDGKSISII
jgi:predicted dehydrogenase